MLNALNPWIFVVFTFTSSIAFRFEELYTVNVVPVSPSTVGLLIDTDIGEPSCSEVTLLFTSTMPADVPRKSIEVIY
jgi:hypothetical protein